MLDRRDRWILIAYCFLVTGTFGFLQPYVPLLLAANGLDPLQIGWASGLATGIALLLQPIWGHLSDHWDTRRPIMIGCALAGWLAYSALRLTTDWWHLTLLCAMGVNATFYLTAAVAVIIGNVAAQSREGGSLYASIRVYGSIGYIVVSLGTGIGLFLGFGGQQGLSRSQMDALFTYGPLMFIAVAIVAAFAPDPRRSQAHPTEKRVPWDRNFVRFLVCYFIYNIALYGSSSFLSLYMQSLGASPLWISGMFAAGVVVEVLVMQRSGVLSDRYGRRPILAITFLILPLRLLLYVPAMNPGWVLGVQLLHGINFGIMGAVSIALVNDVSTAATRGRMQARLAVAAGIAMTIGPILFGFVGERRGLPAIFGVASVIALVGAVYFMLAVQETHPHVRSVQARLAPRWGWLGRWLDDPPRLR